MEAIALFRLILFPLLTLGLLFLGAALGSRILLSEKKLGDLQESHWSEQNRAFWNVHLYGSFLRLFSNFLMGLVLVFLLSGSELDFPLPLMILLVVLGMLVTVPPSTRFRNRVRRKWNRVDLTPYRGRMFLSLLYLFPVLALIVATVYVPREISLTSLLIIFLVLAGMIGWQAWGGVWLSIRLGILKPADEEWNQLVTDLAEEMGVSPPPQVFVANTAMLNAFAYQTGHAVFLTRPLLDTLTKQQIRALTAHELGHLEEGTRSHLLRVAQPLTFLPILCLNPLVSQFGFALALLVSLVGFVICSRLYAKFLQRAEFEADAAGHDENVDSPHLAEALILLYRENLVPAVLPRGGFKTHPDLYDRVLALGVTPDYERPATPKPPLMALLALAWIFGSGFLLLVSEVAIQLLWDLAFL